MTRQEALTELLAKVEFDGYPSQAEWYGVFPDTLEDDDFPRSMMATQANVGWIDAAKALHEAVLPGWTKVTIDSHRRMTHWTVDVERLHSSPSDDAQCITGRSDAPARAWLIAVIKALIAMENDT